LTHEPAPPYTALSEPLIHLRGWLKELVESRLLTLKQEGNLVDKLMSMWFGERTLLRARAMVVDLVPRRRQKVDETLANFDRFRLKCHDLHNFLKEQPWKQSGILP